MKRPYQWPFLLLCACAVKPPPVEAAAAVLTPDLSVDHTAFVLRLPDDRVLRGLELQGAIVKLTLGDGRVGAVRLASIAPDPENRDILRHEFQVRDQEGAWQAYCEANFEGETCGVPVSVPVNHPGHEGAITLSCASGAVVKCLRYGYPWWGRGPHGEDLAPYHAACVHMIRADYCGDGRPATRAGTFTGIYDDIGIRLAATSDPDWTFEAGWAPQGAVCVARTRWLDLLNLDQLRTSCPRLAQVAACTKDLARARGALLYNDSRQASGTDR